MNSSDKADLLLNKALSYANGYRELGMFKESLEELSNLPEKLAIRIKALQMKLAVYFDAKDWPAAECVAKEISLREPNDPSHFVNLAFATRRAKSTEKAKAILLNAVERFPNVSIVHYNLGCYACISGDLETAKDRLVKSISLDPAYLDTAKCDEDLTALAEWLENLEVA